MSVYRNSPLERGASSSLFKSLEEAGCVAREFVLRLDKMLILVTFGAGKLLLREAEEEAGIKGVITPKRFDSISLFGKFGKFGARPGVLTHNQQLLIGLGIDLIDSHCPNPPSIFAS
jgi:hypothetical protein